MLSFPFDGELLPPGSPRILGDVIISVEQAERQALERSRELGASDYTLESELTFLLIHGALHLMGYDHLELEEAERMERMERELFLRFSPHPPREHHKD